MKTKTFAGGYRFRGFEGQSENRIVSLGVPRKAVIPLSGGFGAPLQPSVNIGDSVFAGQIIGRNDNTISSPVHSSINGKVAAFRDMKFHGRDVSTVIIEGDGTESFQRLEGYSSRWEKLTPREIESLLYRSGVTSLGKEGIPTQFKTSPIGPEEVEDLIIQGVGSDVYNLSLDVLLQGKNLLNFIEGARILKAVMPRARIHLAVSKEKKEIMERIWLAVSGTDGFEMHSVLPKYPQDQDEVLIPTVLRRKFPRGRSAASIGAIVLSVQAVLHAFEAVAEGKPLIERTVALCGPSFRERPHVRIRVGTPLESVLKGRLTASSSRIILNSLLTGLEVKNLSVPAGRTLSKIIAIPENREREFLAFVRPGVRKDSYSNAFLSSFIRTQKTADTNLRGEERPCIQCGYCISVCPAGMVLPLLNRIAGSGKDEMLERYGISMCIDCNLCSYVCPCKIPLARNLRDARRRLMEAGMEPAGVTR